MTTWSDAFSTTPALADVMSDRALLRHMLAFESALVRALADGGGAPASAADAIAAACASLEFDEPSLFADAAKAGALTIPLVKLLTARTKEIDAEAAAYVHFGATSQDVLDSASILQLDLAIGLIEADLDRLCEAAAALTRAHRSTPMLGRTLLQPATPIVFGLKTAQWLAAACDSRTRLTARANEALHIQFGGAAGTLGSLGARAEAVAGSLARRLTPSRSKSSETPALPWHTRRGALVALAAELGIATGVASKIARDVSLMMQFEVAEAMEPAEAGRGGSSAMPHKRNPVLCMLTLAAGVRAPHLVATLLSAMTQEHERGLGGWQAEWAALPELVKLAGGAIADMAETLSGLVVDADRMRKNFDSLRGLPMTETASLALARSLGREGAHKAVEAAARKAAERGCSLAEALADDPQIRAHASPEEIDGLVDPTQAQGAAQAFIDIALARWKTSCAAR